MRGRSHQRERHPHLIGGREPAVRPGDWLSRQPPEGETFQIAWEQLAFASGDADLVAETNLDMLRSLYLVSSGVSPDEDQISVWMYPSGDPLRAAAEALFETGRLQPNVQIAPGVEEMTAALAREGSSVGLLPTAWLSAELTPVEIPVAVRQALRVPILAALPDPGNPDGQAIVACLQSGDGQDILADTYLPLRPTP